MRDCLLSALAPTTATTTTTTTTNNNNTITTTITVAAASSSYCHWLYCYRPQFPAAGRDRYLNSSLGKHGCIYCCYWCYYSCLARC